MDGRRCKVLLAILVAAQVSVVMLAIGAWYNVGRYLDVSSAPQQADAILVMGGEGGAFARTRHAVRLYEEGYAPVVVLSGGSLAGAGIACTSTALSLEAATALGLPEAAILLAPEAQSTLDEARNVRALAEQEGWRSLLLVTDRFHTRRSQQTMVALLPDAVIRASAPDDPLYNVTRWWANERSLVLSVNEIMKLGFYWIEYGIRPWG
jgi:uncharacterized SAM-binding protein YcdF (DUF218 family)